MRIQLLAAAVLAAACGTNPKALPPTPPGTPLPPPPGCPSAASPDSSLYAVVQTAADGGVAWSVQNFATSASGATTTPRRTYALPADIGIVVGFAVAPNGATYVTAANNTTTFIAGYCPDASGAATPFTTLTPADKIEGPLAFDGAGNLYTSATNQVDEYAPDAGPSPAAVRSIVGAATQLVEGAGLAVDATGAIYAGNETQVTVYGPQASENAAPQETIGSSASGLLEVLDTTVDASGNVYVLYGADNRVATVAGKAFGLPAIAVYASSGAAPSRVITGPATQLGQYFAPSMPEDFNQAHTGRMAMAVDGAGNIYVESRGLHGQSPTSNHTEGVEIAIFGPAANGNVAPTRTIDVTALTQGLYGPTALAVDSHGNVYAGTSDADGMLIFDSTGGFLKHIDSSATGLGVVTGIAFDKNQNVVVQSIVSISGVGKTGLFLFPNAGGTGVPTKQIDNSAAIGSFEAIGTYRLVIDSAGNAWEVTQPGPAGAPKLVEFSLSGTSGAPIGTFADPELRFEFSQGLGIDAQDRLYVGAQFLSQVRVYAAGTTGTAAVPTIIYSDLVASTLNPALALDAAGTLYVASCDSNSFSVFPKGATTASRSVIGPKTLLNCPHSIDVDSSGNVYVADTLGISVFAPAASGNAVPLQRFLPTRPSPDAAGDFPFAIAVAP